MLLPASSHRKSEKHTSSSSLSFADHHIHIPVRLLVRQVKMEIKGRRRHIPAFGEWNQRCEELPITQYFEAAMQAGLAAAGEGECRYYHHAAAGEVLLFRAASASPPPHKPAKKVRSARENRMEERQVGVGRRRQGPCVADGVAHHAPRRPRVVRAVDEDLYKVPPELLRKKAKGRKNVRSLWLGCVGLNCVA